MFGLITCRQFAEFLFDYVEETLPEPQRIKFERHLAHCAQCRVYLSNYRETIALTRGVFDCVEDEPGLESTLESSEPPQELIDAIIASVKG